MTEFSCRNHHLMRAKDLLCPICGEPCVYMDGLTSSQWVRRERWEDEQSRRQVDEEDDPEVA